MKIDDVCVGGGGNYCLCVAVMVVIDEELGCTKGKVDWDDEPINRNAPLISSESDYVAVVKTSYGSNNSGNSHSSSSAGS